MMEHIPFLFFAKYAFMIVFIGRIARFKKLIHFF